jgi:hypothetical protein
MKTQTEKLDHVNKAIARWETRLKRAVTTLDKLKKQRKRLERNPPTTAGQRAAILAASVDGPAPERPRAHAVIADLGSTLGPAIREAAQDAGMPDIPDFLRRDPAGEIKAAEQISQAAEAIRQERADIKRRKAAGRIAKMKAKKSGETRKMPLGGNAALEFIRNEE